jgi:hypothetical protein
VTESLGASLLKALSRYGGWVSLLPIPLWLLWRMAIEPTAAWHAHYVPNAAAEPTVTRFESALSHYWTGTKDMIEPAPVDPANVTASFNACMSVAETVEVPLMLVTSGTARLIVDDQTWLEVKDAEGRVTRGKNAALTPGVHHLRVEFTGRSRPAIALLASFDGTPPRPVGSGKLATGIRLFRVDPKSMTCAMR